jgi:Sodium/hydrogen exchanger family
VAGEAGSWQRCRDMETLELLVGLLAAVAVAVRLAGRTAIPEPVLLVLAGLAVALIPGLPTVELDPQLTLALFLPPLLYWAALHIDLTDLRRNLRPIALLAVGLVLATTAAVAVLGQAVLGLPLAVAVVLGAVVSPPDPVAAAVSGAFSLGEAGGSWPSRPSGGRWSGWPSASPAAGSCAGCPRPRSRTRSSCCCRMWPGWPPSGCTSPGSWPCWPAGC